VYAVKISCAGALVGVTYTCCRPQFTFENDVLSVTLTPTKFSRILLVLEEKVIP
jgi:hypothetical protein